MKTRVGNRPGAAAKHSAAPEDGASRPLALGERVRRLRQACRQIAGIPDYERYLAHMAEHHPDEPVLSRETFFAQSIDRKYGRSGPRCC
jgi:uncharacterized short protein YbdD (DUF466 family)